MLRRNNNSFIDENRLRAHGFTKERNKNKINNENEIINSVGHSGNSDIDMAVEVNVDTTAIGFAILCSLLATGQMTDREFQQAVKKLEGLTKEKMSKVYGHHLNDPSHVKLYNLKRL